MVAITDISNVDPNSIPVLAQYQTSLLKSATQMVKDSVEILLQNSTVDPTEVAKENGLGKTVDASA